MKAGKPCLVVFSLVLLILNLSPVFNIHISNQMKSATLSPAEMPINYTRIGYYVNSSSPYSNGAFHLLKHGAIGNSLVPFSPFTNLSQFSLIIVPFKLNWTLTEISLLESFISQGGIAFLTASIPTSIFDLSFQYNDDFWIIPTDKIAQSIGDKTHLKRQISYYRAAQDTSFNLYPFDIVRNLTYISNIGESSYEILHTASLDSSGSEPLGYATVAKKIGSGRLVFSTIPFFDLWAMSATGGPTVPSTAKLGLLSGLLSTAVNQFITQLFLMHGTMVPLRWHTPYNKLGLICSRDDVDNYKKSTVITRGIVDRNHGIPSIFYELLNQIPVDDWPEILDKSIEFPDGYHIPGYHRHSGYEITAQHYLDVVLDIEKDSGTNMYFECHHGAGSGFFGQDYVRSAINATNNLDHFVLYTSSEGGSRNEYIEPYLYLLSNGTVIRAKNYYSLPKVATIDNQVLNNDVTKFKDIVKQALFQHRQLHHVHYLLHSQNVQGKLSSYYDNLLTHAIDPIYDHLYTDPISFVHLNLNFTNYITTTFKSNNSLLDVQIQANQNTEGYTFAIPYNRSLFLSTITLDDSPIDLDTIKILHNGDSGYILFYANLTKGTHNLLVHFQETIKQLSVDQDFDGIQDEFEVSFFKTSPSQFDSDYDGISDGEEIFVYNTDPGVVDDLPSSTSTSSSSVTSDTSSSTTSSLTNTSKTSSTVSSSPPDITTSTSIFGFTSFLTALIVFVVINRNIRK